MVGIVWLLLLAAHVTYGVNCVSSHRKLNAAAITQAGCPCIASWTYAYNSTSSDKFTGCANPDADPKGAWCPVDTSTCPGYYGSYVWQSKTIYYDYCGPVRAVTEKGCLCKATSEGMEKQGDGLQKPFQDGCANQDQTSSSWCYVNLKTCKKPLTASKDYDFCAAGKNIPMLSGVPDGTLTTQGGCKCAANWGYTSAAGVQGPFMGCNGDDLDPKGSWCVVDPATCPSAYGKFMQNGKAIYYAYCNNVTASTQAGCLCKPSWAEGKVRDACANPDGKVAKWCDFMPGTCKTKPAGEAWDFCEPVPGITDIASAVNTSSGPKGATTSTGGAAPPVVVVVDNKDKSESKDKSHLVIILVPVLTGIAALVTISYTLFKCHKKHKFYKSTTLLKLAETITTQNSGQARAEAVPAAAGAAAAAPAAGDASAAVAKSTV